MLMRRFGFVLWMVAVLIILTVVTSAQESPAPTAPIFGELEPGAWANIPGPDGTTCSTGTPYSFFVRPASEPSDKLLIHFQGGGACWMGSNCSLAARPSYDPFVDESDDPTNAGGIADFSNPENPFADYNMVLVPYCTGDVHIGASETSYEAGDEEVTVNHNGYHNATAVLDWTFENIPAASNVFVTGCSAGSIPSPFYVWRVAEQYPDARIVQLGDASGAYRNVTGALTHILRSWGTFNILSGPFADIAEEEMSFEKFYSVTANEFPDIQFSQFNAANDRVQMGFVILGGLANPNMPALIAANQDDIRAALHQDNFHTYTANGNGHCITVTPEMYTLSVGGVRFIDWLTALANGDPVEDVPYSEE